MKSRPLPRRHFMKLILASAAAPLVLPSRVFGATAPSNRINLAVIGTGLRSTSALLPNFLAVPDAQILALCDCDKKRCADAAEMVRKSYAADAERADWKGVQTYGDFREVLARPDIDGVIIATPDQWHVPIAIAAIRAGKDVYVEKPLSVAMTWSWKLRTIVDDYRAVFQYGTQQRSFPSFRYACELVRNGYIGKLRRIEAWGPGVGSGYERASKQTKEIPVPEGLDYDMWLGPAPLSPYTEARATNRGSYYVYDNSLGFIAGWGAHPLDIAQWGNNSDLVAPVEYEGTGTLPLTGLFDTLTNWDVRCRYANGVEMRFMDDLTAKPVIAKYRPVEQHGTTFFGDDGWVTVDRGLMLTSDPSLAKIAFKPSDERLMASNNHYQHFVQCIKTRQESISPIRTAINSDLISHLSDICIRLGRKVAWDPKAEQIIGDAEATRMLDRPLRAPWTI